MKNKLLIISIFILLVVICLIGYYFLQNKKDNSNNDNQNDISDELSSSSGVVDIVENEGISNTSVEDITISNVSIMNEDKKVLYVELTSKKTNLNTLTLNLVLLNSGRQDSANQKKIKLSSDNTDLDKEKYKKVLLLDIDSIYNEPKQIKFIFEK